ncbi:hypothetical protein Tco_1297297, partial [Tanacetum coccineum]
MLKVSPWKGVIHFGKRGKLNRRYIGPFKIIAKVGTVAYRLELPKKLSRVHSTFHVSKLKKCMADEPLAIPLDEIQVDDKLNFIEEPVEIMDREGYIDNLKRLGHPVSLNLGVSLILISLRHWKRNCPQYLAELLKNKKLSQGASGSGIFNIELYTFPNKSWVYDTGGGTHICNTNQGLRASRKLKPAALRLYVGN